MKKKKSLKVFVSVAMLSSIAYLLMLLNFPMPPFPGYLMVDFSDIPALVGTLIFGPAAGIMVELIKNILDFIAKGSPTGVPVGNIANFIAGILYIIPTYYIYQKLKSKKGMTLALIIGTLTMSVLMSILNYFVILPAYTFFLNQPAMSAPVMRQMIISAILPFNILKGLLIAGVFMILFAKLQTWISKQMMYKNA